MVEGVRIVCCIVHVRDDMVREGMRYGVKS